MISKFSKGTAKTDERKDLLSDDCLANLIKLLQQRVGLVIPDHDLAKLYKFMAKAIKQFKYNNCEEYISVLQNGTGRSPEFENLISAVTIGESYFFRYQPQMDFIKDHWLPAIIEQRRKSNNKFLRIWSAGCSSGQEIYSIAILLRELIPDIDDWDLHLLGSDINQEVLSNAIDGCYNEWSFRATDSEIKNRYFKKNKANYILVPEVREMVRFVYHNLAQNNYPNVLTQTVAMDLILCRNVFIYFDVNMAEQVVKRFSECLVSGGYLLLGPSDHIAAEAAGFVAHCDDGMIYYERKKGYESVQIQRQPLQPVKKKKPPRRFPVQDTVCLVKEQSKMGEVVKELHNEDWQKVIQCVEECIKLEGETALLLQYQAKALANLGRLQEAAKVCEKSLKLDRLDQHAYLLKA